MKIVFFLTIFVLLFFPKYDCFAQDGENLEGLESLLFQEIPSVSSIGFFEMERSKAPVYSMVFSKEQLEKYSARSIHELLDMYAVGVNTAYHFFGSLIGHRGIQIDSNAKTVFMYGGVNLNQRFHFGYTTPLDMPLMGDIEKIEVINGPGAITQGSGAINGIINVIPKNGADNPGVDLMMEHGFVDNLNKVECSYGKDYKEGDLFFYFGIVGANGYRPDWDDSVLMGVDGATPRWAEGVPYRFRAKKLEPVSYKATLNWNHGNFSFLAYYTNSNVTPLHDPQYYMNTMDNSGTTLPSDTWDGQSGVWRQQQLVFRPNYTLELNATDEIELESHVQLVSSGRYDESIEAYTQLWANNSTELEYFLKPVYKTTRIDKHNLAAGFSLSKRYFYDKDPFFGDDFDLIGESNLAFSEDSLESYGDFFNWLEYSIFCEDQISITDALTLIVGGRFDSVEYAHKHLLGSDLDENSYWEILPRLAVAYELRPGHVVRASYQKGFRHPDVNNQKTVNSELAPVKSETVDSFEVGYSGELSNRTKLDTNMFFNTFTDTIGWASSVDPEQPGFGNLTEEFSSIGGEVILKADLPGNFTYNLGYAFARPFDFPENIQSSSIQRGIMEVDGNRNTFARYPKHQIKTNLTRKFFDDKLTAHTSFIYTTAVKDMLNQNVQSNYRKDRYQLDVSLSCQVRKNFELQLILKNLTRCPYGRPAWSASTDSLGVGNGEATYYLVGRIEL